MSVLLCKYSTPQALALLANAGAVDMTIIALIAPVAKTE
jgi:hypothetical protein